MKYFSSRLFSSHSTIVVRKYLPQTQEIKDIVQIMVSAGISDFLYNKYSLVYKGDKVNKNLCSLGDIGVQGTLGQGRG